MDSLSIEMALYLTCCRYLLPGKIGRVGFDARHPLDLAQGIVAFLGYDQPHQSLLACQCFAVTDKRQEHWAGGCPFAIGDVNFRMVDACAKTIGADDISVIPGSDTIGAE